MSGTAALRPDWNTGRGKALWLRPDFVRAGIDWLVEIPEEFWRMDACPRCAQSVRLIHVMPGLLLYECFTHPKVIVSLRLFEQPLKRVAPIAPEPDILPLLTPDRGETFEIVDAIRWACAQPTKFPLFPYELAERLIRPA